MNDTYSSNNVKFSISKKSAVTAVNLSTAGPSEDQLQASCFQWAWNQYPQTRLCLAAVPNGGSRHRMEAAKLKATGVIAGVHDLFFYWNGQLYWFELKVGYNKQSKEQKEFGEAMKKQGAICYEIRSLEQFQQIFINIIL